MKINFNSSKHFIKTRDIHSQSDNIEIMVVADTNEIIKNLFNSLLQRYQKGLEESMRGSDFVFDYVESLNYIFHKVDLKRSGSYIKPLEWIKNEKSSYRSKYNLTRENQVILLMITDGEKWHYLTVRRLRTLLKGIT